VNEITPIVAISLPLSLILFQFTFPKGLDWIFRIKIPETLLCVLRFALFFPIAMLTIFDWTTLVEESGLFRTLHLFLSKLLSLPLVEYLAFFCDIGVLGYTFFGLISSDANRYRDQPFYWQYRKAMYRYALSLSIFLVITLLLICNLRVLAATVTKSIEAVLSKNEIKFDAVIALSIPSTMGIVLVLSRALQNIGKEYEQIRTVIEDCYLNRNPRWLGILVCMFMIAYQSILSKAIWMIVVLNFVARTAIRVFRKDTFKKKTRFSMQTILDSWWNADRTGRFAFLMLISTSFSFLMQWITKSPLPTGGSVYLSENIITVLNVMDVFLILLLVSISRKKLFFAIVLPFHVFVRYISPIMLQGLYLSTSYSFSVTSFLAEATRLELFPILTFLGLDFLHLAYFLSFDSHSRSLQKLIEDRKDNVDLLKKTLRFAKLVEISPYLVFVFMVVWFSFFFPLAMDTIVRRRVDFVFTRDIVPEIFGLLFGLSLLVITIAVSSMALRNEKDCLSKTFRKVDECIHEDILSQNSKDILRKTCFTKKGKTRSYSYFIIYIIVFTIAMGFGLLSAHGIVSNRFSRSSSEHPMKLPGMEIISGATFLMGNNYPNSSPIHEVTITYDFYITISSIKLVEYMIFCASTGREEPTMRASERQKLDVVGIDWYDAIDYCNWLSDEAGLPQAYDKRGNLLDVYGNPTSDPSKVFGYRLPTEAEWEHTAKIRLMDKEENLDYCILGREIFEWCSDFFDGGYYSRSPVLNPYNSISGSYRAIRNTGYKECSELYDVAYRDGKTPRSEYANLSFSVCKTIVSNK